MIRLGDMFKSNGAPRQIEPAPRDVEPLTKATRDRVGHLHDEGGRFTGDSTSSGNYIDTDEQVRQRRERGEFRDASVKPHEVHFMFGGGGSGKGGYVKAMTGSKKDRIPHAPGFENARVHDPDAVKRRLPGFTGRKFGEMTEKDWAKMPADERSRIKGWYGENPKPEWGGPSGPTNRAEFDALPENLKNALRKVIADEIGIRGEDNIGQFARSYIDKDDPNRDEEGTKYGGGLLHEISSFINDRDTLDSIRNHNGHTIIDRVGSLKYEPLVQEAIKAGKRPVFHHVYAPAEVAQMRNFHRDRYVSPEQIQKAHQKAAKAAAHFEQWAESEHAKGNLAPTFYRHESYNDNDLDLARKGGFTEGGREEARALPEFRGPEGQLAHRAQVKALSQEFRPQPFHHDRPREVQPA